jgi:hypothetical protein
MCPTLGFDTKQRKSFLIKFGVFTIKKKILTNMVKYEKITLFDEIFSAVGSHKQQAFYMFK